MGPRRRKRRSIIPGSRLTVTVIVRGAEAAGRPTVEATAPVLRGAKVSIAASGVRTTESAVRLVHIEGPGLNSAAPRTAPCTQPGLAFTTSEELHPAKSRLTFCLGFVTLAVELGRADSGFVRKGKNRKP